MKYTRIKINDGKSTCPICGHTNDHMIGDICSHCVKITVKGVVFYAKN